MKSRMNYKYQDYDSRYAYIRTLTMTQFAKEYPEEVPHWKSSSVFLLQRFC